MQNVIIYKCFIHISSDFTISNIYIRKYNWSMTDAGASEIFLHKNCFELNNFVLKRPVIVDIYILIHLS